MELKIAKEQPSKSTKFKEELKNLQIENLELSERNISLLKEKNQLLDKLRTSEINITDIKKFS